MHSGNIRGPRICRKIVELIEPLLEKACIDFIKINKKYFEIKKTHDQVIGDFGIQFKTAIVLKMYWKTPLTACVQK